MKILKEIKIVTRETEANILKDYIETYFLGEKEIHEQTAIRTQIVRMYLMRCLHTTATLLYQYCFIFVGY